MTSSPACLFCRIQKREIPAMVVYEDAENLAFLDITPRAPGHTLLIPKVHVETILELPDESMKKFLAAVRSVSTLLLTKLHAEGLTIGINHGRASGQEVDHLHVHLIPRFFDDQGGSIQSVVYNPPRESLQDIANTLRE